MMKYFLITFISFVVLNEFVMGCLITNCPRGGKRSGRFGSNNLSEAHIKPCISCGPARSGQCFGPNICCGPFGCLMGTADTARCQREGYFQEREPCVAGTSFCRRSSGRCAADGICCNQEACFADKGCADEKNKLTENLMPEVYGILSYPLEIAGEK